MYKLPEQLISANKASVETLATFANATFAGVERLAALNLNTARAMLEDSVASTRALLAVKDVQDLVALQSNLVQPGLEKAAAYSRSIYDIASETQGVLSQVVDAQVSDLTKNASLAFEQAVKVAPAGSDQAVTALRSALSAANSAYDSMSKAAKQVTELAEARFADVTATVVNTGKKAA